MFSLGLSYELGQGVEQDDVKAALWYEQSAQLGSGAGMNNFAELLAKGRGVPKDLGKALEWYRKAADLGNVYALYNMGWYLEKAGNLEKARACYEQAKAENMDSAYWSLGRMYEEGLGVDRDLERAYTVPGWGQAGQCELHLPSGAVSGPGNRYPPEPVPGPEAGSRAAGRGAASPGAGQLRLPGGDAYAPGRDE